MSKQKLFFSIIGLSLLLSLSLLANDALNDYRINGTKNIEKIFDTQLTELSYWEEYLKSKDTTFGYVEGYANILACNKEKSTLTLYVKDATQNYAFKKAHNAYTGENSGDKVKEGDKKTPIGIYKITEKLSSETNLDPFYGPLAFVTSYPNSYDKLRGKNGSGIWIHGLPKEQTRDEFTRGCIAIDNKNIECLDSNIKIDNTLLIIDANKVQQNISKDILASLLTQLYKWRYAWLYSDIEVYLGFYAQDFIREDGLAFEQFQSYKRRVFQKIEKKTIIFKDINIIPYPGSTDIYQITFHEYYRSDSFMFSGDKALMVRIDSNKEMQIFTEK